MLIGTGTRSNGLQIDGCKRPVSWLLINGRIHTMDQAMPRASALAIDGEQIVAVDDATSLHDHFSAQETLDLAGRCVIPGLTDAHVHFQSYALNRQQVDLFEVESLQAALARVSARVVETPPEAWIRGHGWHQELWTGRAFPTTRDLDRVTPNNPVALTAKSDHAWWVNSRALEIAGITNHTPDPSGGQILRDSTGNATGILLENAIGLVQEHVPQPPPTEIDAALHAAFAAAWKLGITGIHDCDGRSALLAYQRLHQTGRLGLRVHKLLPSDRLDDAIGVGLRSGLGDDWLWIGHVKVFADGALGLRTAWMIDPYQGASGSRGIPIHPPSELEALIHHAARHGFACAVHAIGDRANQAVLDAFERISEKNSVGAPQRLNDGGAGFGVLPHRIEHVQLLHPDDVSRLARSGIVASMQPIHATQDMDMAERYWGKRSAFSYAWRSLLDHNTVLAFGSDSPIEELSPFLGIYAAVSRRRHTDGAPGPEGWYPEQRLSVTEAVFAYTMGAAYAAGMSHRTGSLSSGKLADLVVLDRDIWNVEPEEILNARPLGTMVGGQWVYRLDELS
jgi:predicted amidohydrolase YtcJ